MTGLPRLAADFYAWDVLPSVLGPSYHPGGLDLTGRMAGLMRVPRGARVLDVASGPGASAHYLAEWFGWNVVGVDASPVTATRAASAGNGVDLAFLAADARRLPFRNAAFDAAVCECSLCLFGDEGSAMREIARVLRPGARIGLSDVVLSADASLSAGLRGALAAVACVATAMPVEHHRQTLEGAGLRVDRVEDASWALGDLLASLRGKARAAIDLGLGDVGLGGFVVREVADLLDEAWDLHGRGDLGYAVLIGTVAP